MHIKSPKSRKSSFLRSIHFLVHFDGDIVEAPFDPYKDEELDELDEDIDMEIVVELAPLSKQLKLKVTKVIKRLAKSEKTFASFVIDIDRRRKHWDFAKICSVTTQGAAGSTCDFEFFSKSNLAIKAMLCTISRHRISKRISTYFKAYLLLLIFYLLLRFVFMRPRTSFRLKKREHFQSPTAYKIA